MKETASVQFNLPKTTTYIIMPLAFTGKDKRFEGLTNAYQFLLAEIYTLNKAFKQPAKITYTHLIEKFGMSKDTISPGFKKLEELGIIEKLGNSRYKIIIEKFNERDYIKIDDYLLKQLWNVKGKKKRLAYSRIKTLAFLRRMNENEKTDGIFASSQARIGVAVNLPKSTAGDCVRELSAIGVINLKKADEHYSEAYKRGLTVYTVVPELLAVRQCKPEPPPDVQAVKEIFRQHDKRSVRYKSLAEEFETAIERAAAYDRADEYAERFKADVQYNELKADFEEKHSTYVTAILSGNKAWEEREELTLQPAREALKSYLKARGAPTDIIKVLIRQPD